MGGSALGIEADRMTVEEYNDLYHKLKNVFPMISMVKSYKDKPSFGDMDVLYPKSSGYFPGLISEVLNEHFQTYLISFQNSNVYSVGICVEDKIFQVDFICIEDQSFDFAYNYFAYNDLGNLLGRVARNLDLKFGFEGLYYTQRSGYNENVILLQHQLTNDFDEALMYLGYNPARFLCGFNNLEEIFEFVVSSPYYSFHKFDLTQRNRKARVRDEKRPNYRKFLEWAKVNGHDSTILELSKEGSLGLHLSCFPNFRKEYDKRNIQDDEHQEYVQAYNGNKVRGLTGLEGKQLGRFMEGVSHIFGKGHEDEVIALDKYNLLDKWILSEYNKREYLFKEE